MPNISLSGTATQMNTPADLFAFLETLVAAGWRGSVTVVPDGNTAVWAMEGNPPDGSTQSSVSAALGDYNIVLGSSIFSAMTTAEYQATYGS